MEFPVEDIEKSIPQRFEKMARMYPDQWAIVRSDEQTTYDELNKAANRLARSILTVKAEGRKPVVLFFEPSISLIIAYLVVLKAGQIRASCGPAGSPRPNRPHDG